MGIVAGVLLMVASAAADVSDPDLRSALLDTARAPVSSRLGKTPVFKVNRLVREGDWAFLLADMQQAGGRPLDYAGTPLAEDAREGAVSNAYAALMRRDGDGWTVVATAIGPGDVAWADWSKRYGAPAQLFG